MRTILLVSVGVFLAAAAAAQPVAAPRVSVDDSWTYQDTTESRAGWRQTRMDATVVRVGPSSIVLADKPAGSTMPPTEQLVGPDWSRVRSIDGHETVVNRPLAFPLSVGKSWDLDYTDNQPSNRQHSSEHYRSTYKATGWEDVTVPAGTFHAIKIEAEGTWTTVIAPANSAVAGTRTDARGSTTVVQTGRATATTATGRTYKAFWYVPAVKRWVKSDEEYYDSNGVRNDRFLEELAAYKVAN
jgi:hypothetical protein